MVLSIMSIQVSRGSVANAAVYPPSWAALKSPATGQKTVGRLTENCATFHPSTHGSFFFQILSISCQFREFLSPFDVQEHSIH